MARIHGLTLIRDEWPLALLSINHALLHHVDRLHCAVQVSSDATLAGVQQLRGFWGERLTVVEIRTPAYLQEAIVATLVRQLAAAAAPGDWLYVFDADEFAVTPSALPLRPDPQRNRDLSRVAPDLDAFLDAVDAAAHVVTDRLHIAVSAVMLGKRLSWIDPYDRKISSYLAFAFAEPQRRRCTPLAIEDLQDRGWLVPRGG